MNRSIEMLSSLNLKISIDCVLHLCLNDSIGPRKKKTFPTSKYWHQKGSVREQKKRSTIIKQETKRNYANKRFVKSLLLFSIFLFGFCIRGLGDEGTRFVNCNCGVFD